MKKSDVTFHSDGYREGHAAVNVKVRARPDFYAWGVTNGADPRFTEAWVDEHTTQEDRDDFWNEALKLGWDQLDNDAESIFGKGYHVHSEGRSGGWAIVCQQLGGSSHFHQFGREAVETWDAIALGRWAHFVNYAQADASDVPYQYVDLLYWNVFNPWAEHADAVAARLAIYVGVAS